MAEIPDDRRYSKSHEWFKAQGNIVMMGITQFAADELTDITYVELPDPGTDVTAGQSCGEIESVKATSELYSQIAGKIAEKNEALESDPGLVNSDPFGQGWMLKIEAANPGELDSLMDVTAYKKMLADG